MKRLASHLIVGAVLIGGVIGAAESAGAQTDFGAGDDVVVATDALNLREEPGLDAPILDVLVEGQALTVTDGPESADSYAWYEVESDATGSGWVVGEFLAFAGGQFQKGDGVRIVDGSLNERDAPGLDGEVATTVPEGTVFTISEGPTEADGYDWYKVHSFGVALPLAGNHGWAAGDFLVFDPSVSGCEGQGPCPTGLQAGDGVWIATDLLNLRDDPGLDADIVTVLPNGAEAVIDEVGQSAVDGYVWLRITTSDEATGWVVRDFVVADPSAGGSPEFAIGDDVMVADGPLSLRKSATTAADLIDVIPEGELLTIEDGPMISDGYTWYQVAGFGDSSGWVAGEFLELS